MTDKYRYVLDSSIWVEIDRGNLRLLARAEPLLLKNSVCMIDLIIAELLRGARSKADYNGLKLRLMSFQIISTTWLAVSELGYLVAKGGFQPPLADLYIAQACIENDKTLITQDKHFKQIREVKKLKLEIW